MRSLVVVCLMAVLLVVMLQEIRADVINGNFDHGLSGWTAEDDYGDPTSNVVINSDNQAVLSTSGILTGPYLVSLWQMFEVPYLAATLSFDINFSNTSIDVVLEPASGSYPDFLQASYLDEEDSNRDMIFLDVDKDGFYNTNQNSVITILGDNWFRYTTRIMNLAGNRGKLYFDLNEMDDGWYSTAKVDNIIITSAPIPEPSTLLLMGCGMVGLMGTFRKKIRKGLRMV